MKEIPSENSFREKILTIANLRCVVLVGHQADRPSVESTGKHPTPPGTGISTSCSTTHENLIVIRLKSPEGVSRRSLLKKPPSSSHQFLKSTNIIGLKSNLSFKL